MFVNLLRNRGIVMKLNPTGVYLALLLAGILATGLCIALGLSLPAAVGLGVGIAVGGIIAHSRRPAT